MKNNTKGLVKKKYINQKAHPKKPYNLLFFQNIPRNG